MGIFCLQPIRASNPLKILWKNCISSHVNLFCYCRVELNIRLLDQGLDGSIANISGIR